MIEKYMDILKKDIETIIDESKTIPNYAYGRTGTVLGIQYHVILKNGLSMYIASDSNIFPEINMDEIVYVRKRYLCEDRICKFMDTEVGVIYTNNSLGYGYMMEKLFNAHEDFNTGCYD